MNGLYYCKLCEHIWIINLPEGTVAYAECPMCHTIQIERTSIKETTS